MSSPLEVALEQLTDLVGQHDGLLPTLPADAVMARFNAALADGDGVEVRQSMVRLLELMVTDELGALEPTEVADSLRDAGWTRWPSDEQAAIAHVLDDWWSTVLAQHPHEPPAEIVLATLCRLDFPLVRWLQPLLEQLDGPAAVHLSEIVLQQLPHHSWNDRPDERSQILNWCRSEPVVMGLTVVGGVHLAPGVLGEALDLLL